MNLEDGYGFRRMVWIYKMGMSLEDGYELRSWIYIGRKKFCHLMTIYVLLYSSNLSVKWELFPWNVLAFQCISCSMYTPPHLSLQIFILDIYKICFVFLTSRTIWLLSFQSTDVLVFRYHLLYLKFI